MKPNIVLFVCDDLRFDALGCAGNAQVKTPHLDQFAAEGLRFSRCSIPGGTHGAVCMPSRAMLHTGRPGLQLPDQGQDIDDAHVMMGEHFARKGYHTFHTGKWHNERRSFARGFQDGDQIFFGGMDDPWATHVQGFDPHGVYNAEQPATGKHATDLFVDTACEFVARQPTEQPFFLSVALTSPHDPRTAPEEFHALYSVEEIELPDNFLAMHPHDTGHVTAFSPEGERVDAARDEDLARLPRRPAEIKQHIADYYAMTSHLDAAFGRLRASLEARGIWENTIVAFTADHGLAVGQHGLMGKQNLYEHSLRIPLILRGPGVPKGQCCDARVCHFDLYRTFCELIGLEVPASVAGLSLIPVWSGATGREEFYLNYANSIRGLIQDGWKLIEYAGEEGYRASQLFDLTADPRELRDRIHDPDQQERVLALRRRMQELRDLNGDAEHFTGKAYWSKVGAGGL
ncbi:sulfatase-like hydrolase/transferase [Kiritimatiellota bacterium B12222]|nr:sulfatase-like hydrolase/transferase [Kiritimatiellota bacterium B12222]